MEFLYFLYFEIEEVSANIKDIKFNLEISMSQNLTHFSSRVSLNGVPGTHRKANQKIRRLKMA